jgi:non-ribosomal peptide synthetase-like protein
LAAIIVITAVAAFIGLTFIAWRRYLSAGQRDARENLDTCPYSLTEVFGERHLANVPHQQGIRWLTEVFTRSAKRFPDLIALQIPHTGESLTFAELDERAEDIAAALSSFLTGPDQVVAVAMSQDNWQIVASHLGILKAGGTLMFLDTTLPEALITHMLNDAQPVVVLTRGQANFRNVPTLDVLTVPKAMRRTEPPPWLDDPTERLAAIFYTSGTTGMPRGVECPHAGYVNLALSYADYFDLVPGMDATSLTSSLGYDGSISEMYSAWVSGCAVVILTREQVRSGPDLVPVLREAEVTVLFCPPVLLTTLTSTPEVDLPYPLCRYIVPAGEAFPNALVEPWTRGRRQIINTYGPTEASTDTSRQSLRAGEPITIGSPFANVTYVVLEIDQLRPLPHGEVGELCIGGIHVARGYRNLPLETVQKFVTHPQFGRLYRTGDKCKIDIKTQRVHFLGRIDAQLKVRGHRVEAQPVEDILQTQFKEIEAAVLDYQNESLVAFVAAPSIREGEISLVVPAPAAWAERVTATLATQLPAPSVPSKIFLVEKFAMKPVSGKIDRMRLPNLAHLLKNGEFPAQPISTQRHDDPESDSFKGNAINHDCEQVLAICRSVFEAPLGLDDEFANAGGHSIVIARLAQRLQAAGWIVPVRALLTDCNTARKIAQRQRLRMETPQPVLDQVVVNSVMRDEAAATVFSVRYFTFLQFVLASLLYSPGLVAILTLFAVAEDTAPFRTASVSEYIAASFFFYLLVLAVPFVNLLWVMTIKLLLSDTVYPTKVTPGIYPKWSKMHLRIWFSAQMQRFSLVPLDTVYRSAPLRAFALKRLGAKVGKNLQCAHDAYFSGPLGLLTIEDNVAIQSGAYIQTISWTDQHLRVGPVHLQRGCKIGMRASVANDVTVGRGSWITPFTAILSDVGSQEIWEGSPARLNGRCVELKRTANTCRYSDPIWLLETVNILMQQFVFFWISAVPIAVILWFASSFLFKEPSETDLGLKSLFKIAGPLTLDTFVTTWVTVVVTSLLACLFIRFTASSPGLFPSRGLRAALLMYRVNRMNSVQRQWTWTITGQYLRALAGVRFPHVGASECDVMYNLVPEATTADSQVFWSNGGFTNMLDCGAEHFRLRRLDMPRNFFSGNNSVAEYGQFPSNFLLGVSSPASEIQFRRQMRSRLGESITVAGNPPVKFRSASFEEEHQSQAQPSFPLFLTRVLLNDLFSIGMLPVAEGLVFMLLYLSLLRLDLSSIASAFIAVIFTEVILVLLCVAIKKFLIGKNWGSDHATPFWSWKHFAYFFAQDCFFSWCRTPLAFCAGTVLANPILRWMGCRIGKRTIVAQPMQCFDWNAVSFGNDCYVDGFLQFHTLENMMLKVKRTHIHDGCAVNTGVTLMGGAVIEKETTLYPLSLVLKEMNLVTGTYEGSPAQPALNLEKSSTPAVVTPVKSTHKVDNTDWLKTIAIVLVLVDHFGYFFMEDDQWWSLFGRLAAPTFFFLLGYAKTRRVPLNWIWLGLLLTLLDSWYNDWDWVAPNILLSFALVRLARPYAETLLQDSGWVGFALLAVTLLLLLPVTGEIVDYGAEGWLWALFGLSQRRYVDDKPVSETARVATTRRNLGVMRLLACLIAGAAYVWREQIEFSFPQLPFVVFILVLSVLSLRLCLFRRGLARVQPPKIVAGVLGFTARHTLVIYAIELAAFQLIAMWIADDF